MSKCGKGCLPECEYFTTGGCISPFNCPYKVETGYINTATSVIGAYTQGSEDLNEPKIKKWFRSLVEEGKIQQEPMNYDAATLQIYIDHLEKENAALRERLSRAVELPVKVGDTVYLLSQTSCCPKGEIVEAKIIDFIGWEDGYRFTAKGEAEWFSFLRGDIGTWVFTTRDTAEARLAELKGEKE